MGRAVPRSRGRHLGAGPDGRHRMGRRWVYYRLRELADAGRVVQTLRGNWRTAEPGR